MKMIFISWPCCCMCHCHIQQQLICVYTVQSCVSLCKQTCFVCRFPEDKIRSHSRSAGLWTGPNDSSASVITVRVWQDITINTFNWWINPSINSSNQRYMLRFNNLAAESRIIYITKSLQRNESSLYLSVQKCALTLTVLHSGSPWGGACG